MPDGETILSARDEDDAVKPAEAALHRAIAILLGPVPVKPLDETAPPRWVPAEGRKLDPEGLY
jgi:hypothetical protein